MQEAPHLFEDNEVAILMRAIYQDGRRQHPARSSVVGEEPRWRHEVPRYSQVIGVEATTATDRVEVVLNLPMRTESQIRDGLTGRVLWERPREVVGVVDDAGGDGRADLLVEDLSVSSKGRRVRAGVVRLEAGGGPLWRAEHHWNPSYSHWTELDLEQVGDMDGDGIGEFAAYLSAWVINGDDELLLMDNRQLALDGRTGSALRQGQDFFPLNPALHGGGSDAVRVVANKEDVNVSGMDLEIGQLWATGLGIRPRGGWDPCLWLIEGVEAPGTHHVFISVPTAPGHDQEVLLDGRTGEIIWHLDS